LLTINKKNIVFILLIRENLTSMVYCHVGYKVGVHLITHRLWISFKAVLRVFYRVRTDRVVLLIIAIHYAFNKWKILFPRITVAKATSRYLSPKNFSETLTIFAISMSYMCNLNQVLVCYTRHRIKSL